MKVAVVSSNLYSVPPKGISYDDGGFLGGYGGESQVHSFVRALNRRGVEVELFGVPGSRPPEKGNLHYLPQGDWNSIWDREKQTLKIYRKELGACDIWHDWSLSKMLHHYAYTDFGRRCIMTPWGTGAPVHYRRYNTVLWSAFHRGLFLGQGYPESTKFVWGGVEPGMYPPRYDEGENFLFLSRMHPSKRPDIVLNLAAKMKFPLIVAGDTESPDHLHYLIEGKGRWGKYESIRWKDDETFREKVELYQHAKALLVPSMSECFGLVVVEAMACGCPVILSNDGAYPEIVEPGRTGFLCTSMAQYENAIRNVDVLDRRACRESVEKTFNADRMAAEYVKIYGQVLNGEMF